MQKLIVEESIVVANIRQYGLETIKPILDEKYLSKLDTLLTASKIGFHLKGE